MSRTKSMLALASSAVFVSSVAQGSVTPYDSDPGFPGLQLTLVFPPYTAGQLADDPTLAQYCTYDLQVVVSSGTTSERWASADLRGQLSQGTFYIPPAQDSNAIQPPGARNATGSRYLQVDTFVDAPIFNATRTVILGRSRFAPVSQNGAVFPSNGSNFLDPNDPNGTTFLPANDMTLIDAAWGDSPAPQEPGTSNGTFTIARLTMKLGAVGTFIGRIGSTGNPGNPVSFTYTNNIPEPTSGMMLAAGLGAVALRRRR